MNLKKSMDWNRKIKGMKKEFEAFRSKAYAYVFLALAVLCFIVGVFFSVMWIEWSLVIVIASFTLFIVLISQFIIMFLKQDLAVEVIKDKMTIYQNQNVVLNLDEIKSITIDNNPLTLKMLIKANDKEENVEIFISNLKQKREEFVNLMNNLEIKVIYDNNVRK